MAEGKTVFSPALPCKHHVESNYVDLDLGESKEVIKSKKIIPAIKIILLIGLYFMFMQYVEPTITITNTYDKIMQIGVPIFFAGYCLFILKGIFTNIYLCEYGIVKKGLGTKKAYAYTDLMNYGKGIDHEYYDRAYRGTQTIFASMFSKRFYVYYEFLFSNAKSLVLRPRTYAYLKEKMEHFDQNLIDVKVKTENNE